MTILYGSRKPSNFLDHCHKKSDVYPFINIPQDIPNHNLLPSAANAGMSHIFRLFTLFILKLYALVSLLEHYTFYVKLTCLVGLYSQPKYYVCALLLLLINPSSSPMAYFQLQIASLRYHLFFLSLLLLYLAVGFIEIILCNILLGPIQPKRMINCDQLFLITYNYIVYRPVFLVVKYR